MSFTLINQYIIVIQMISHNSIKYSYFIIHTFLRNLQISSVATSIHISLHFGCTFNISLNVLSSHRFTNPGTYCL